MPHSVTGLHKIFSLLKLELKTFQAIMESESVPYAIKGHKVGDKTINQLFQELTHCLKDLSIIDAAKIDAKQLSLCEETADKTEMLLERIHVGFLSAITALFNKAAQDPILLSLISNSHKMQKLHDEAADLALFSQEVNKAKERKNIDEFAEMAEYFSKAYIYLVNKIDKMIWSFRQKISQEAPRQDTLQNARIAKIKKDHADMITKVSKATIEEKEAGKSAADIQHTLASFNKNENALALAYFAIQKKIPPYLPEEKAKIDAKWKALSKEDAASLDKLIELLESKQFDEASQLLRTLPIKVKKDLGDFMDAGAGVAQRLKEAMLDEKFRQARREQHDNTPTDPSSSSSSSQRKK